jgi:hypothetical protein
VNAEDLKCQQRAEHEYDSLYSVTLLRSACKIKSSELNEDEQIVKMTMNENE